MRRYEKPLIKDKKYFSRISLVCVYVFIAFKDCLDIVLACKLCIISEPSLSIRFRDDVCIGGCGVMLVVC